LRCGDRDPGDEDGSTNGGGGLGLFTVYEYAAVFDVDVDVYTDRDEFPWFATSCRSRDEDGNMLEEAKGLEAVKYAVGLWCGD